MNKSLLLALLLCTFGFANAQSTEPCGTDILYTKLLATRPAIKTLEQKADAAVTSFKPTFNKANGIIYIPVVFHVIHQDGPENISQEQIMNQIDILNEDFRKKNGTPGFNISPVGTDMQIEFRLAQYDPNGKKHDGIIRIKNAATENANDDVKELSYWNSAQYLNIWVVSSINLGLGTPTGGTVLGYAQFPWLQSSLPTTDGIVIRSDQVGVIGSGQLSQGGRTLTHEIGHWIGLFHTFQGGCAGGTSSNCASQGDRVCDTPPVSAANFGCDTTKNTCNNDVPDLPDQVRNYMDYSDGTCMNMYTEGQKARAYSNLLQFRNVIYGNGTNNVAYAGIDPATGNYAAVPASQLKVPVFYGFETTNLEADGWQLNNFNNSNTGWQLTNSVAYSGNTSMIFPNFSAGNPIINTRDGFQTPTYDLSTLLFPYLNFYYAHAQRSSFNNDSLIVLITSDFGRTERRIFANRNPNLATSPAINSSYVPTLNEWRKISVDLSPYRQFTNARFRFEFVNRRGNNMYVDDFSITNFALATHEVAKESVSFLVYPNPMQQEAIISFTLDNEKQTSVELKDIAGKTIRVIHKNILSKGIHQFSIDKNNLASGVYFIDFKTDNAAFTHKLLVN